METVIEPKEKKVKRSKFAKKHNNSLAAIFGLLKGKIFYDDSIFSLDLKKA